MPEAVVSSVSSTSQNAARHAGYFPTLDGIRAVAALLIAIRHTPQFWGPIACQESYLAVDIFFVLSGVVICHNYEKRLLSDMSALRFSLIRLIRIYPLYLLGSVIGLVALICAAQPHAGFYFLLSIFLILDIGFGVPAPLLSLFPLDGPAWSLFFEIAVNVFYGFCAKLLSNRVVIAVIFVSFVTLTACIFIAPHHTFNIGFTSKSFLGGFPRVGYSFFAGVLLYRLYRRKSRRLINQAIAIPISLGILVLVAAVLAASPPARFQYEYDTLMAVILFPALVYVALHVHPEGRIAQTFKFGGAISYALYAVHEPIGRLTSGLIQDKIHVSPTALAPLAGFALLSGMIAVCAVLDKAFDAPVRRFLLLALRSSIKVSH